jgi:hypothetical protein
MSKVKMLRQNQDNNEMQMDNKFCHSKLTAKVRGTDFYVNDSGSKHKYFGPENSSLKKIINKANENEFAKKSNPKTCGRSKHSEVMFFNSKTS